MATAIAYHSIDMNDLTLWNGEVTAVESGRIEISSGAHRQEYFGSFSYGLTGLAGGMVDRTVYYDSGDKVYEISGGPYDALVVNDYISNDDLPGLLSHLLVGSDQVQGSAEDDVLHGFGGDDEINGGAGDDELHGAGGDDVLDGGDGVDTAMLQQSSAKYTLTRGDGTYTIAARSGGEGTDSTTAIEMLAFGDATINLGMLEKAATVEAGQVTALAELYVAYFDRAPDAEGLHYWASLLADGASLNDIAKSFFDQAETRTAYPSTQTREDFVTQVYQNILDRAPDVTGLSYWSAELANGAMGRDNLIMAIIAAAHSSTGSTTDSAVLSNKAAVGVHFAITRGLSDWQQASLVMAEVDASANSKTAAIESIDHFYDDVIEGNIDDFIIQLTGNGDSGVGL